MALKRGSFVGEEVQRAGRARGRRVRVAERAERALVALVLDAEVPKLARAVELD